jgi:hypothetical protein
VRKTNITINRQYPLRLKIGNEVIEIFHVKNKGSASSEIAIYSNLNCEIEGPHIVKRQVEGTWVNKDELKNSNIIKGQSVELKRD